MTKCCNPIGFVHLGVNFEDVMAWQGHHSVRAGVRTQCWIFYTSLRIDHFVITSLLIQLLNILKTYLKAIFDQNKNLSDFWRSKLKTNNCGWENDFTPLSHPAFTKFEWILLFISKKYFKGLSIAMHSRMLSDLWHHQKSPLTCFQNHIWPQTKMTQLPTPFWGSVFHALSLGVIHFVLSVRSRNHFFIGWNSSTAN